MSHISREELNSFCEEVDKNILIIINYCNQLKNTEAQNDTKLQIGIKSTLQSLRILKENVNSSDVSETDLYVMMITASQSLEITLEKLKDAIDKYSIK